jgi:hypothetical protein
MVLGPVALAGVLSCDWMGAVLVFLLRDYLKVVFGFRELRPRQLEKGRHCLAFVAFLFGRIEPSSHQGRSEFCIARRSSVFGCPNGKGQLLRLVVLVPSKMAFS